MREEHLKDHHGRHGRRRGEGLSREEKRELREGRSGHGAKTFRRGRAIAFLEHLETKRDTLKKQLASTELQAINIQIAGELKATESIVDEFKKAFELYDEQIITAE